VSHAPLRPARLLSGLVMLLALAAAACTGEAGPAEPVGGAVTSGGGSVEERVADLLSRMTLEEKLGQMALVEKGSVTPEELAEHGIGAVLSGGGGAPRPNTIAAWRELVAGYQEAAASTRLGIPVLYGVDAVHGHNNLRDAVVFPHNVGLGATRDAALVEAIGRATAVETAATDIRWTYAPVLAVPQDIRWGRTYEAYAEDPDLVAELGAALVRGLQGSDLGAETSVLATPKHWVGDGGTGWGTSTAQGYEIDQGVTLADEDELRRVHVAPYPSAFEAGAITVMASYSSWRDGKVHGDRFLLTDLLRDELGFDGLVVSDWGAVDQVVPGDHYASVVRSIEAGIDLVMVPTEFELFLTALRGAVEQGDLSEERIDEAVGRILTTKLRMGLFDRVSTSPELADQVGEDAHRALARRAVAASAVLLTTDGTVPVPDPGAGGTVLVAGPAAHDVGIQSGGWTISWQGDTGPTTAGTTVLEGLEEALEADVLYDRTGRSVDLDGVRPSVGVAVVGERPYAEGRGDSATLALSDRDVAVVAALRARVDRLVVVLISGRPLVVPEVLDIADVVVAAWLPGSEGAGVADVLTGAVGFSGRLPYTWPEDVTVLDRVRTGPCDGAVFPYGYGLDGSGALLADAARCDQEASR
jgi:beta-glucosidase